MNDTIKTNLILFKLGEFTELVSTMNSYENNYNINNLIADNLDEVKASFKEAPHGLLLFTVKTKADFQALVAIFKHYHKEIKSGKLKLALIQTKKNYKIEAILRKFGCNEFLESDIKQKSLRFKVDFWTKNILKNLEREKQKELNYSRKEAVSKKDVSLAEVKRASFKDIDPIKEEVDIWIAKENNCKKVLSKWLISMHGPSPHIAHWESCGDDTWKFLINEESKSNFYSAEGYWYFSGLKPEFNWKEKLWSFSSQEAKLYFKGEEIECCRLYVEEHTLNIAQNSTYANLLRDKILDSAQSSFNIERAKKKEIEDEKKFKDKASKKDYLEGESTTDSLDSHLKGKTKGEKKHSDLNNKIKELAVDKKEKKKDRLKIALEKEVESKKAEPQRDKKNIETSALSNKKHEDERENLEDRADKLSQDASVIVRLASEKTNTVYLCKLEDLEEELLYLSYESLNLPQDDIFGITLTMDYAGKKISINTKGKIKELEEEVYCLDIDKIEFSALESFMKLYEQRQDNILEFLKMARGF